MVDKHKETESKVSLEDLLKVKRAERPSEQFWGDFDRELHQRMLQTLVKKDPLYIQILRGLTGRIAQTTAVAGIAALCMMTLGRTLIVDSSISTDVYAEANQGADNETVAERLTLENAADIEISMDANIVDYEMANIDGTGLADTPELKRDFTMESLHIASLDKDLYSGDPASLSLAFMNQSVASLVY